MKYIGIALGVSSLILLAIIINLTFIAPSLGPTDSEHNTEALISSTLHPSNSSLMS